MEIRSYEEAKTYLERGRYKIRRPIASVKATTVEQREDGIAVKCFDTDVVTFYPTGIVLKTDGFYTKTTMRRIETHTPATIYQKNHIWHLHYNKQEVVFKNGMFLGYDGSIEGAASEKEVKELASLHKRINEYAKNFAEKLVAGKIDAPSGGDCWACHMVDKDGNTVMGNEHLLSHMEEKYYVPSLLMNAFGGKVDYFTSNFLYHLWSMGDKETALQDRNLSLVKENTVKVLKKYLRSKLVK